MKIKLTTILSFLFFVSHSQINNELSSASFQNESLEFSVGNIYLSGQIESGLIAQSLTEPKFVNVTDFVKKEYSLYPNPTNYSITLEHEQPLPKEIKIHNNRGQLVIVETHLNGNIKVDQLPPGLYFIKLSKNQTISFIKD